MTLDKDWINNFEKYMMHFLSGEATAEEIEFLRHFNLIPSSNRPDETLYTMPYDQYLKTDHWRGLRAAAIKRAGHRCQICNSNQEPLHVHHRTYERRGQELPEDLTVLCSICHDLFHENGRLAGGAS